MSARDACGPVCTLHASRRGRARAHHIGLTRPQVRGVRRVRPGCGRGHGVGRAGGEQPGQPHGPRHAWFVRTATAAGTAAPARLRQARPAQAAAHPAPRRAGDRPVVHGRRGGGAGRGGPVRGPGAVPLRSLRGACVVERRCAAAAAALVVPVARAGAPCGTAQDHQGGGLPGARAPARVQPLR